MIIILWLIAIFQWLSFIYLPLVALYGVVRIMMKSEISAVICSPFLGIKKVSMRRGFIIWLIQAVLFGGFLYEMGQWKLSGINPLIRMW